MKFNEAFGLFQRKLPVDLGTAMFEQMLWDGVIVDGRAGGIVIGKSFEQGGVPIIFQRGREFLIHSFTQNGEFILNRVASTRNLERIKAINAGMARPPVSTEGEGMSVISRLIITEGEPCDRFLWLNWSQVAVTSDHVEQHLVELDAMNSETNPYSYCDAEMYFPRLDLGTEDGIV